MHRIHLIATLLLAAGLAHAGQIYHWVDEEGVPHYSQTPPADVAVPVETREVATSTPDDYDPDDYEYSVMNQAARIHAEWTALAEERAKEQEAQREARRAAHERLADESYERREDRYGRRYGRAVYYPPAHLRPPFRPGRKVRRDQFRQLDELGLWREPPAYSINSTRHWQRVEQTRSLAVP